MGPLKKLLIQNMTIKRKILVCGIKGGLGNQLFQYATCLAFTKKFNADLQLDTRFLEQSKFSGIYKLDRLSITAQKADLDLANKLKNSSAPKSLFQKVRAKVGIKSATNKPTHFGHGSMTPVPESWPEGLNEIYFEEWFTEQKVFKDYREDILKEFEPVAKFLDLRKDFLEGTSKTLVAIHIRRGDYVENPYFNSLDVHYYKKAIERMNSLLDDPLFCLFSDDLEFAKEHFGQDASIEIIESDRIKENFYSNSADLQDLFLMSQCDHNIIANSTFSWWSAWLNNNPNKTVLAPEVWYKDKDAQKAYESGSFIPSGWTKFSAQ